MLLPNLPDRLIHTQDLPSLIQAADSSLLHQGAADQIAQTSAQPETQSAEDFYELGVELHQAVQVDASVQAYQNAIRLNSILDSAYINLGLAFVQLDQLENAKDVFQQVLVLPDRSEQPASIHTLAHYNLAIILKRQGEIAEAIREVQNALTITPNFEWAQQLLQQLQS